jgi:hypothetical protein
MAFTPTNQLSADANIILRDQRHASRLLVDDQFRLAPKLDFQFHVAFSLNQGALRTVFLIRANLSKESFIATGVVIACIVDVIRLSVYGEQIFKNTELMTHINDFCFYFYEF